MLSITVKPKETIFFRDGETHYMVNPLSVDNGVFAGGRMEYRITTVDQSGSATVVSVSYGYNIDMTDIVTETEAEFKAEFDAALIALK